MPRELLMDVEPVASARSRKVLLVTHDDDLAAEIGGALEEDGFHPVRAVDAEDGLFRALQKDVDAFVVDLEVAGGRGVELCTRLRGIERYRRTPILIASGAGDETSIAAVYDSGADDFVSRPINPRVLRSRLGSHTQRMESLREVELVRANLNRYVSQRTQRVVEAYSRTGVLPPPEQRELCVMFADVRGFTELSREIDHTTLFYMLSRHLGMQVDCVYRHGGYVDKFGGDGIMAIFDGERRAEQACLCALDIVDASKRGPTRMSGPPVLPLGIGINLGRVLIGNIGSSDQLDYSVIGEPVNLAARLCGHAEPMQIIASRSVAQATEDVEALCFVDDRDIVVKGVSEPLSVCSLERNSGIYGRTAWRGMEPINYDRRTAGGRR